MEPEALIAEIEQLDAYQLRQFKALYAGLGEDRRNLPRQAQYVADAIAEICRQHLKASRWRKLGIEPRSEELHDWLGDQTDGLSETQHAGLVLVVVKAIAARLQRRQETVDIAALLDGIKDVGRAMEEAYPGYWSSRLLYRLVRQADRQAA